MFKLLKFPDLTILTRVAKQYPADFMLLTGFGSGLSPIAPGTVGTLMAVAIKMALPGVPWWGWLAFACMGLGLGVIATNRIEQVSGIHDPGWIVIDEMAAYWLVVAVFPKEHFLIYMVLFLLFRGFDIFKPWPAGLIDRQLPGGLGVMLDDVIAALYTIVAFIVLIYIFPGLRAL